MVCSELEMSSIIPTDRWRQTALQCRNMCTHTHTYVRMYVCTYVLTCTYIRIWLLHMHAMLVPAQQWSTQDYECCPRRQCQREHSPLHFLQKKIPQVRIKINKNWMHCVNKYLHLRTYCTCLLTLYTQRHTHTSGMCMHLQTSTHTYVRAHKQEEKHTIWMCPHNTHIPTYVRTYSIYTVHTY